MLAVRARALLDGRFAPSIDDVLELAEPVLKHRMALTFAARAEGETIPNVIRQAQGAHRIAAMAEPRRSDIETGAVTQAAGGAPHARRVDAAADPGSAPRRRHRHPRPARPPARRIGREFLAVPPLHLRRAGAPHRLAALGARRPSLCARARMGSRAHHLALAGPLALDGVRLGAGRREQARPRAGRRLRARRSAGAGRRARRHSRPDAADREPQRHRADGGGDRCTTPPSAPACRRLSRPRRCPRSWCCPTCGARSPKCSRTIAQLSANGAHGHVVQIVDPAEETFPYSGRVEFIEPEGAGTHHRRPRRDLARRLPGAASRATAPRSAPRPTGSAGASPSTAPTGRRASCCWRCMRAWATARDCRSVSQPARAGAVREGGMIAGLPLGFAQPLVLLGLLSLPVLWWLLRLVPPRPRRIKFPPTRLLFEIAPKEETPARTPWWLTLLRLTLAALVIIAAAGPLWNPPLATAQPRRAAAAADRRRLGRRRHLGRAAAHRRRDRSRAPKPTTAASRCCRCRSRRATFRCSRRAPRACSSSSSSPSRIRVDRSEALPAARALPRRRAERRSRLAVRRRRSRQAARNSSTGLQADHRRPPAHRRQRRPRRPRMRSPPPTTPPAR